MKTRALSLAAAALFALGAATGCRTFVPLTQELRDQNHLSEAELENLQYYVSSTITLRRELDSGGRRVTGNHRLLVVAGKSVEDVVIESKTPGVCVGVGQHTLSISFEQGTSFDFAPAAARSYALGAPGYAEPDPFPGNRSRPLGVRPGDVFSGNYQVWVSPQNTVEVLGKRFDAVDDTEAASLLIDAQSLDEVVKLRKVLPGLRLPSK